MGRVLALDVGEKRIGIAVSDALNITAQGLETINRQDIVSTFIRIKAVCEKYAVEKVVVGMPLNMNGSKGERVEATERFMALLKKELAVPIETIDERLTTMQGERVLLEADISRRKRKLSIDKIAAQLILQAYLASKEQPF